MFAVLVLRDAVGVTLGARFRGRDFGLGCIVGGFVLAAVAGVARNRVLAVLAQLPV